MTDVAFFDVGSPLTVIALSGLEVGLAGFSLGAFGPTNPAVPERITVTDLLDSSILFDAGELTVPGTGNPALVFSFTDSLNSLGFMSPTGLQVSFLLRSGIVAIDNLRYSATPITQPPQPPSGAIPLPAAGWLLLTGLGGLGALARLGRIA